MPVRPRRVDPSGLAPANLDGALRNGRDHYCAILGNPDPRSKIRRVFPAGRSKLARRPTQPRCRARGNPHASFRQCGERIPKTREASQWGGRRKKPDQRTGPARFESRKAVGRAGIGVFRLRFSVDGSVRSRSCAGHARVSCEWLQPRCKRAGSDHPGTQRRRGAAGCHEIWRELGEFRSCLGWSSWHEP